MKKKTIIITAILGGIILLFVKSCHKSTSVTPTKTELKDKINKIFHEIITAEKGIQKEVIKNTIKDVIKDTILAPDPELEESSHFVCQPGIGFVYIDKSRLSLDIHFWRHKSFGALAGAAIDLKAQNQPVKGFIAGTYTLPFIGFQSVSIFAGTSERALIKLNIKKAEIALGIRIKLPL